MWTAKSLNDFQKCEFHAFISGLPNKNLLLLRHWNPIFKSMHTLCFNLYNI